MHRIPFKEMQRMIPEWCFDGNLVYWEMWDHETPPAIPTLIPCVILEYFIFDLDCTLAEEVSYEASWHDDEWLYISAYADGEVIEDVHSAFSPLTRKQ